MDVKSLSELLLTYNSLQEKYDFYTFLNQGQFEPLLSIYTRKALRRSFPFYISGEIKKYSLKHLLETGNVFTLYVEHAEKFKNCNSKNDLLSSSKNVI